MSDLNQCTFTGRLGADPEIRRSQEGKPIANLRLAVSDTWRDRNSGERKEKTEWISVTIFSEGLCKISEQYLRKGSKVLIQGSWKTRKWTDQSGNDRYSTECVLQGFDAKLQMLDPPDGNTGGSQRSNDSYGQQPDDYDDNSDIPF
ncbi:single-stranded DNA-binding protein [Ensifer adhaerens]|uniref:single-stranded DNA-binding protein n=1 Tax=Ensifer adhaerens TaxID=106592 RepID=UPI000DC46893|nr:single-stranded DNA-binding protein [Ensifer adhaerens]RAS13509.1 single-strand binding protein [Ensifer adhaerens]